PASLDPISNARGGLHAVQERVDRGRTSLDPVREAVATRAPVVGRHVNRLGWSALNHVYVDAPTRERSVLEHSSDRRSSLSLRGHTTPSTHASDAKPERSGPHVRYP